MGAVGSNQNQILSIWNEPYSNPTQDISPNLRRFSGTIRGVDDIERQFYQLPTEPVKMVKIGEWMSGSGPVGSWVFADGTHSDLQFSKDRNGNFYLESVGTEEPARRYYNG